MRPPLGAPARGGLQTENRLLDEASNETNAARHDLIDKGIAARAVAFVSPDPESDLARLAQVGRVDLVLMDGRRPLLGEGVPRGDVGRLLETAPCDVGVLVAKEGSRIVPGPRRAIACPSAAWNTTGLRSSWARWIASATGAPLNLLGAAGQTEDRAKLTRLLGDAALLVQQSAGVAPQPVITSPGKAAIVQAAERSALLVVGLSSRWRKEGLGETRSAIARSATAPIVFVRRGTRPGALAQEGMSRDSPGPRPA